MDLLEFTNYYNSFSDDFLVAWKLSGTGNFLEKWEMNKDSKELILKLIDILEGKKSAIKVEDLEVYLN